MLIEVADISHLFPTLAYAQDEEMSLSEFANGTNYGIQHRTRNILPDEKIGGTIHLALGAGYPKTGSVNKSAIHWDMITELKEGREIRVDGSVVYKNGIFQL